MALDSVRGIVNFGTSGTGGRIEKAGRIGRIETGGTSGTGETSGTGGTSGMVGRVEWVDEWNGWECEPKPANAWSWVCGGDCGTGGCIFLFLWFIICNL